MYPKTLKEARVLVSAVYSFAKKAPHVTTVVCPPAVFLPIFSLRGKGVSFGAQDIDDELVGSKTGHISAPQVASVGAAHVIIGHAECRSPKKSTGDHVVGDTNEDIGRKLFTALTTGLTPILCIGEQARDKEGRYIGVLREQLRAAFTPVPLHLRTKVIIAYEPLYAIGAPQPPATAEIHQSLLAIKKILLEDYGGSVARVTPLLYGGAVAGENVRELVVSIPELSGFLVGRASVDVSKFKDLVRGL